MVTLLGSGTPGPRIDRFGPSTLVQAGGLNLVFDAGRGSTIRLTQSEVPLGEVHGTFLTHFHSDHVSGLADLWMTSYLKISFGGRTEPFPLYGPPGTENMASALMKAFTDDARIREADENVDPDAMRITPHEFAPDRVVFDRAGVRVTAFTVNHGPLITPAVGFRVDYAGRSVLLSGDTTFDENLIRHGQDVDLLLHEVAVAPAALENVPNIRAVLGHHTEPEDCGTVFSRTRPRLAAYTHIVQLGDQSNPAPGLDEIEQRTRTTWTGPLRMGADLTRFVVAASGVTVEQGDPNT